MKLVQSILKYLSTERVSRVTYKICPVCGKNHIGSATKCDCGFPLPPPCRVMTSTGSRPLNYEEIALWSKNIGSKG